MQRFAVRLRTPPLPLRDAATVVPRATPRAKFTTTPVSRLPTTGLAHGTFNVILGSTRWFCVNYNPPFHVMFSGVVGLPPCGY